MTLAALYVMVVCSSAFSGDCVPVASYPTAQTCHDAARRFDMAQGFDRRRFYTCQVR